MQTVGIVTYPKLLPLSIMKTPHLAGPFFTGLLIFSPVSRLAAQDDPVAPPATEEDGEEVQVIPVADLKRTEPVDFAKEIQPLLKKSCIACHNASKSKGKLNLETPISILKGWFH